MTNKPTEPPTVDMSPEAIDRRFRMVEALRKLCVSLKEAGERAAGVEIKERRGLPPPSSRDEGE